MFGQLRSKMPGIFFGTQCTYHEPALANMGTFTLQALLPRH